MILFAEKMSNMSNMCCSSIEEEKHGLKHHAWTTEASSRDSSDHWRLPEATSRSRWVVAQIHSVKVFVMHDDTITWHHAFLCILISVFNAESGCSWQMSPEWVQVKPSLAGTEPVSGPQRGSKGSPATGSLEHLPPTPVLNWLLHWDWMQTMAAGPGVHPKPEPQDQEHHIGAGKQPLQPCPSREDVTLPAARDDVERCVR